MSKLICELPDTPKNFDGGSRGGVVSIVVGDNDVIIARYEKCERASEEVRAIMRVYLSGADEFDLP